MAPRGGGANVGARRLASAGRRGRHLSRPAQPRAANGNNNRRSLLTQKKKKNACSNERKAVAAAAAPLCAPEGGFAKWMKRSFSLWRGNSMPAHQQSNACGRTKVSGARDLYTW